MKRNEYILKRLVLLNVKSIQEGLLQVLNYNGIVVDRKTCSAVLPNVEENNYEGYVDENTIEKTQPVNIMDVAVDFCNKNPVDSTPCKVFVNNIDFKVTQTEFWDFFEHFGKVLRVYIVKDKKTRRSKGFGFVVFSSPFDAQKALNGKKYELKLNGRLMQVLPAVKKKKNEKQRDHLEEVKTKLKEAADYFINDETKEVSHDDEKISQMGNCVLIDNLCDDLLLEIFLYMDICSRVRLERVCRRWHNVAIQSWHQVTHFCFKNVFNLSHAHASLNDRILISMLNKNCVNLKSIDVSASPYLITISSLSKLANMCPNLEEINLSYVPLKKDSAKILGKNLTKLKKIQMSGCLNIGEKGFWWLFKDQTKLEELEITDTSRLIGNCIYMLPTTVTVINFESCSELSDSGLKYLANRCPNILHLNLSFCVRVTDIGLYSLFEKCCNVSVLKLKGLGRNVTPTGLSSITQLKHLVDLDISRNVTVTDDLLHQVAILCKNLEKLNIEACHGNISNTGVNYLCFCDNLRELNVSYLNCISDQCVNELAMEGKLEKLILRSCVEITDECAVTCIKYLDRLVMLDLSGCSCITDEFAHRINLITVDNLSSGKLQIILGGTEFTMEGVRMLQEKLTFSIVTMENYQVGSLRNDRDPTLVRPFFPESSDEEEEEEEEELELIVLKPDIELDISEDYPCVDEDGEKLWETIDAGVEINFNDEQLDEDDDQLDIVAAVKDASLPEEILIESVLGIGEEEEDWDNELEGGRVWTMPMPTDNFEAFASLKDDYDDFLENDNNLSRLELIG